MLRPSQQSTSKDEMRCQGAAELEWRRIRQGQAVWFRLPSLKSHKAQIQKYSFTVLAGHKLFAKSQGIILLQLLPFPLQTALSLFLQT